MDEAQLQSCPMQYSPALAIMSISPGYTYHSYNNFVYYVE